jgi:hypothetical protein
MLTPEEARELVAKHGSLNAAGKAIGRTASYVKRALDPEAYNAHKRAKHAARAPRGPAFAPTVPHVPEAHEVRGVSTYTGADGEVKGQWTKTGLAGGEPEELPPDFAVSRISTMSGADGTTRVKWTSAERTKADMFTAFKAAAADHCAQYRGLAGVTAPPKHDLRKTLTVYPYGDPHIGMMAWGPETGESNDLKLTIERMLTAMRLSVECAPPSEEAWLINIGDALHSQNQQQTTPRSGHKLDVDGRLPKIWRALLDTFRELTHLALRKHGRVKWFNLRGNHDPEVAFLIAMWLEEAFRDDPRVIVHNGLTPHVYQEYGQNLIAMTHGDSCPIAKLGGVMARDRPQMWGRTRYRLWITGHIHHLQRIDLDGCSVETLRVLVPGDDYHVSHGYGAPRSVPVITFDPEHGEILRSTIDLSKILAVQAA